MSALDSPGATHGVIHFRGFGIQPDGDVPGTWISDGDGAAVFVPDDPEAAGFDHAAYDDHRERA